MKNLKIYNILNGKYIILLNNKVNKEQVGTINMKKNMKNSTW